MNYEINDPWDWVDIFENTVKQYAGSKHAIACDSNTNAIRLLFEYLKIKKKEPCKNLQTHYTFLDEMQLLHLQS